ncbi:hypothetical protein TRICI_004844 [Trichomonascus ciferrii]|uniref:Protein-serine/threonine kinase n=1 Tax=Trichomonascus ciferrii TaxID=44093 RepID=A0A642UZ26_9ASCO|nr:hypothetical protein TRICI_004844 [Trichomonascus ciferrii]
MQRRVGIKTVKRWNHSARIAMLDASLDVKPGQYTYPEGSEVINERHFYQNTVLMDHWVKKEARPVSLRQLAFFGKRLNTDKLLSSANFVRTELPVRISHRIRDMQVLPFAVVSNRHLCHVYEQYYKAFDLFRKFPVITSLEDNERFCKLLDDLLNQHLSVIPQLVMGAIENCLTDAIEPNRMDEFLFRALCSRISRRVIAEQHLALTQSLREGRYGSSDKSDPNYIGEVFLQCSARETVLEGAERAKKVIQKMYPHAVLPDIEIEGKNVDTKFPYIKSHLDYIIGEIMRNSIEATVLKHSPPKFHPKPPPILVSISSTPQNILFRISDQGGGIPADILPHIWSFSKGPRSHGRLRNFKQVPQYAGLPSEVGRNIVEGTESQPRSSLSSFSDRPPQLKLGMGLPLSKVYAEYWDGALELQSLEGYGCDVFLRISRLGNQNERLQLDRV